MDEQRTARATWPRWWPGGLAWALWALILLGLAAVAWLDHLSRQAGRPELAQINASAIPLVVGVLSAATVGAVLSSSTCTSTTAPGCCWR
jgi:hypothetical protein